MFFYILISCSEVSEDISEIGYYDNCDYIEDKIYEIDLFEGYLTLKLNNAYVPDFNFTDSLLNDYYYIKFSNDSINGTYVITDANVRYKINRIQPYDSASVYEYPFSNNIVGEELGMLSQKLKKDIQLQDIWSVSYKKGDYHTPHDHGSVGLAGILYLNMPKDAAVTQYIQPWNDWYSDRTIYYPIKVNEGDIVVTPKFVRHFTEPHKSKQIKRIISWDMNIV